MSTKRRLPDSIVTPGDLTDLVLELREYARWSAGVAVKKSLRLKHSSEPPEISATAKELLRSWLAKRTISETSLNSLVEALDSFKQTVPIMTITLAAMPSRSLKQQLVGWCRENISPDVLISFQLNSTMLGGLSVRYGSHIHDWSFRRRILDGRARFTEVLRRV